MPDLLLRSICLHPFHGYRNAERLRLRARALRAAPPDFDATRAGRWRTLRLMAGQYLSREVPRLPVRLELGHGVARTVHEATTDDEGFAVWDIPAPVPQPPDLSPRWETVTLRWRDGRHERRSTAFVLAPGAASPAIVSDIDDTIIETGITGGWRSLARNWRRVLLERPGERLLVPGADAFYAALGSRSADQGHGGVPGGTRLAAPANPVFYISSSPWNLFPYLAAFKAGRALPPGPMLLRDWGFNRATLGRSGHGAHKRDALRHLAAFYPDLAFILVGDDTQDDLPAFGAFVEEHPGRVRGIFIRTTGRPPRAADGPLATAIAAAGVPLWQGPDYAAAHGFLEMLGLGADGPAHRALVPDHRPDPSSPGTSAPIHAGAS
ncbi:DUF2183 domain-containing protein [Erythrobacteraceae bacterium CFH 75059]|uniref:phosphatase domain-containing protein n=1 Tax=Qipengyuania thermophila TaxID=2509361 RepID=UPI00102181DA|nr:phosphatase domain-containing protein [Qipengyuania thermophila]TCD06645.1 DUF2183 domain-containing protein [Erythrobacteraceae bacterium CFH 75059]